MLQRRFTTFGEDGAPVVRLRRPMRCLAVVLLLLVALPFTEPFSVCSPAIFTGQPAVRHAVVVQAPSIGRPSRRDTEYPPLSLTDDQLRDAKAALPAGHSSMDTSIGLMSAVYVTTAGSSPAPLRAPLILRI